MKNETYYRLSGLTTVTTAAHLTDYNNFNQKRRN